MSLKDQMRAFPLFKDCSDEFLASLAEVASQRSVPKGAVILTEGDLNDRLLILAGGQVEVRVAGEKVAVLETQGDLMGEMSVFARRKVTASLHALTDVQLCEIGSDKLGEKVRTDTEFGARLYQLFSEILSDKIISTNAKARQFEIVNRTLMEMNRALDKKVQESSQVSRGRRVLIIEPDRKQQTLAKMSLGGTGVKITTAGSEEEAKAALAAPEDFEVVFLSHVLSSLLDELAKKASSRVVLMAPGQLAEVLPAYKQHAATIKNLITRNPEDRVFTAKTFATTITKLVTGDLLGLEKYMMWGIEAQERPIRHSKDRARLIEEMQAHFKSLGVRSTITDRAGTVAEELLMNAIYDAPTDGAGNHHYAHLNRTEPVTLKESEFGQFRFACDGMLAAVSVADPFGAMTMKTLFDYLERNANSNGESVQDAGKGGAGRGLHQIVENADLVVFNVQWGKKTEVIAFFNLDPSAKGEDNPRSFQFFNG